MSERRRSEALVQTHRAAAAHEGDTSVLMLGHDKCGESPPWKLFFVTITAASQQCARARGDRPRLSSLPLACCCTDGESKGKCFPFAASRCSPAPRARLIYGAVPTTAARVTCAGQGAKQPQNSSGIPREKLFVIFSHHHHHVAIRFRAGAVSASL